MEALVKAGAFDGMKMNRSEILFNYDNMMKQVDQKKEESESGQINLFSSKKTGSNFCVSGTTGLD